MGYPMTYPRVVCRNGLTGSYAATGVPGSTEHRTLIAGDMRRLEQDQRDDRHLSRYATAAGITWEQARAVLEAFFTDFGNVPAADWLGADPHGVTDAPGRALLERDCRDAPTGTSVDRWMK